MDRLSALSRAILTTGTLLTCISNFNSTAADWPQWRGPNRDGISSENLTPVWPPKQIWSKYVGLGPASPSISEGRLYVLAYGNNGYDYLYCLNATNAGQGYWTNAYATSAHEGNAMGPAVTPTVDGDRVYIYSHEGYLYCFNKYTGSNIWAVTVNPSRPGYHYTASPVVEGNLLILNSGLKGWAVNKMTGSNVWTSTGTAGYSSPFVVTYNSERVAILFSNNGVYGIRATNGATVFSYGWPDTTGNAADPAVYNNKFLVSDNYGAGCALVPFGSGTLSHEWKNANLNSHVGSSILIGGYLYGCNGYASSATLKCLYLGGSTSVWSRSDIYADSLLLFASNKLVTMSGGGTLNLGTVSPSGFNTEGRSSYSLGIGGTCWGPMAFSDGRLYCKGAANGYLACLQVGTRPPDVNLVTPLNGANFRVSSVLLTATASDSDGSVTNVEFYAGTTRIGNDYNAPYTLLWSDVTNGAYAITVKAYDNWGVATTSSVASITVTVDLNDNGIADSWEVKNFGTTNACNPVADGDEDGYCNLYEYIAGTDPTNKQSVAGMQIFLSNGNLVVTCPTIQAGGIGYEGLGRYYTIQRISNLTDNSAWQAISNLSNRLSNTGTMVFTNDDSGPVYFYRARIKLQ